MCCNMTYNVARQQYSQPSAARGAKYSLGTKGRRRLADCAKPCQKTLNTCRIAARVSSLRFQLARSPRPFSKHLSYPYPHPSPHEESGQGGLSTQPILWTGGICPRVQRPRPSLSADTPVKPVVSVPVLPV
jgi:hypothetical protein